MEKIMNEQVYTQVTLYGHGIESPVFIDEREYENYPADGICGLEGRQYYMSYEGFVPVTYRSSIDGVSDVFEVVQDDKKTYYHLATRGSNAIVLEGKLVNGNISWTESSLEYEDLRDAYEYFRANGVSFVDDYFQRIDAMNHARKEAILGTKKASPAKKHLSFFRK